MKPAQQRIIKTCQFLGDQSALVLATWPLHHFDWMHSKLLLIVLIFGAYRLTVHLAHYSIRRPFWDELRDLMMTTIIMGSLHAALLLGVGSDIPVSSLLCSWLTATAALPLARHLTRQLLRKLRCWYLPVLLVGNGPNSRDAQLALQSDSALGYRVCQRVIPDAAGGWLSLHPHALVAVALEHDERALLDRTLRQLTAASRDYLVVPALRGLPLQGLMSQHTLSHEVLLLRASNHLKQLPSQLLKRLLDQLGALIILAIIWPALLVIAIRLRREDGPVLFWHERIGRHGKAFQCPKFRTMTPDADERLEALLQSCPASRQEWEASRKLRDDPRVTALGRLLRETSLDELPQLWSVLKGEMSLVGPRPVTRAELAHYGENVSYYQQVLPGITGLWQVSGRSDADYPTRVALDVWYVRNWSVWTDVVILLKTVGVVIKREGAR